MLRDESVFVFAKEEINDYWILVNKLTGKMPTTLNKMIRYARNISYDNRYEKIAVIICEPKDIDSVIDSEEELKEYHPVCIIDDQYNDMNTINDIKEVLKEPEREDESYDSETIKKCIEMLIKVLSNYDGKPHKVLEYISSKYFNDKQLSNNVILFVENDYGISFNDFCSLISDHVMDQKLFDYINKRIGNLTSDKVSSNKAFNFLLSKWQSK